eukprot:TRINITY_DN4642_c0_g2_i1.p1 TRINITY_DN4642_c0_g2~~TRINITY_DN4642_c0_g2_i1.p1  ORF type:complete len:218 (-),score=59.62 TRINITY_DN4642_c0_g2_i1:22-675(-)
MKSIPLSQQPNKQQTSFSMALSKILRHSGQKIGIKFNDEGYTKVEDLLKHNSVKKFNCTIEDVKYTVENCKKQRFALKSFEDVLYIKANQGHSMEFENLELKKIEKKEEIPRAVHGTYFKYWPLIEKTGLNKMGRTHIHFAIGEYGSKDVISGMRGTSEILIYLDVEKCLLDGIPLELSTNQVVLSKGDNGIIAKKYFEKVVDVKNNKVLYSNKEEK